MHICIHRHIYIYIYMYTHAYVDAHYIDIDACMRNQLIVAWISVNKRTKRRTFLKLRFSPHPYLWCAPPRPPTHPSPSPSPLAKCSCEPEAGYSQLHFARGEGEGEGSPYQGPQDAAGAAVSPPPSFSASCDGRVC